jgi:leishmanolysin
VPDYVGGTVACGTDTVLSSAKLALLTSQILPAAFAILQAAVQVNQVTGTINPSSTSACSPWTVTATDVASGISNADIVIYVSAAPISGSTVAFASACQLDSAGRPVIATLNFSPAYLGGAFDTDTVYRNFVVNTAVHELIHALGFSSNLFATNFGQAGSIMASATVRGKTVSMLTAANTLAAARAHFGCATLAGVELEDQGGSGIAGSHWERRGLNGEMMTGITSSTDVLTAITLGLLQDTGFYFPNQDFYFTGLATTLKFGNNAGCSFISDKCNLASGGQGTYFCQAAGDACTCDNRSSAPARSRRTRATSHRPTFSTSPTPRRAAAAPT